MFVSRKKLECSVMSNVDSVLDYFMNFYEFSFELDWTSLLIYLFDAFTSFFFLLVPSCLCVGLFSFFLRILPRHFPSFWFPETFIFVLLLFFFYLFYFQKRNNLLLHVLCRLWLLKEKLSDGLHTSFIHSFHQISCGLHLKLLDFVLDLTWRLFGPLWESSFKISERSNT